MADFRAGNLPSDQISSIGNMEHLQVMSHGQQTSSGVSTGTALPLTSSTPTSFRPQHADRVPMAFQSYAIEPPAPTTPARAPPAAAARDHPIPQDDLLLQASFAGVQPQNTPHGISSAADPHLPSQASF